VGDRISLCEFQLDRLPALAADLVRRQVAVIATASTPGALAQGGDRDRFRLDLRDSVNPVEIGLVASLSDRAATSRAWPC